MCVGGGVVIRMPYDAQNVRFKLGVAMAILGITRVWQ